MARREEILDAAITVLGREGVRALTHRAVDAAAGLPGGSTSNYFRTRDALLDGVIDRVVARERSALDALLTSAAPADLRALAALLAAWARGAVGERRDLTVARFALLVEAANRPELRARLTAGAATINEWGIRQLTTLGSHDPARDLRLLAAQVEASTLHELAYPSNAYHPEAALLALADLLTSP